MAIDITGLTTYVHDNEDILLMKSIFSGKTADLISEESTVLMGVKTSERIHMMETDAIFQNGAGCTRTPSGSTVLTERTVTVGDIAVVEDICINTLNTTYAGRKLKGSDSNKIPFEQEYSERKALTISKQLEIAIWQGNTAHGNANLSPFDGLIKLYDAANNGVNANLAIYTGSAPISTATGITTSNVKSIVNAMWLALPADVTGQDDIRIFCGWDTFNKFINAFTDQNLFNFAPSGSEVSAANGVVIIPGTNYKLTAVHGLDSTNRLFATKMSNIVAATDLENESEDFKLMPDQFGNYLRFQAHFKYGVNWAFPDQVVSFKLV